jgi:hypothetical protein
MDNSKRDPFVKRVADLSKAGEKSSAGSSRDAADGSGSFHSQFKFEHILCKSCPPVLLVRRLFKVFR